MWAQVVPPSMDLNRPVDFGTPEGENDAANSAVSSVTLASSLIAKSMAGCMRNSSVSVPINASVADPEAGRPKASSSAPSSKMDVAGIGSQPQPDTQQLGLSGAGVVCASTRQVAASTDQSRWPAARPTDG